VNLNKYIACALKTESMDFQAIAARICGVEKIIAEYTGNGMMSQEVKDDPSMIRLLHGAIGLETEVGEFMDALKKHIFYGKELDWTNLGEEMGDLMWYIAILSDVIKNKTGVGLEEWLDRNVQKLNKRYPDKFNKEGALKRDLKKEREVLEHGKTGE